jgi:Na+-translocating ferredoxin:NAD+ oxidoreductase subunit G
MMADTARQMARSALVLASFATLGAALLAGTWLGTRERIAQSEHERLLEQLNAIVPAGIYDNPLAADVTQIQDPALGPAPATVYRARLGGQPVAAIFTVIAPDGYSGAIRLLVGVYADGRLAGVRAVAHRETPGLGDRIEHERSDWILGFAGRSLDNPLPAGWTVRRDGGVFDQFTGATITPRAVVRAVRRTLEYFSEHQARVFESAGSTP